MSSSESKQQQAFRWKTLERHFVRSAAQTAEESGAHSKPDVWNEKKGKGAVYSLEPDRWRRPLGGENSSLL